MGRLRVLVDVPHEVDGTCTEGQCWVSTDLLPELLGWTLRSEGLCRGDVCLPVAADVLASITQDDRVQLGGVARLLGRASVVSPVAGQVPVMALALQPEARREALDDLHAPDFSLPDLEGTDHALSDWRGQKRLLVTFASWCGCRYDLPGWQALHDELGPSGFSVIGVAMDNTPEDVTPFTEDISFPVLYDSQHVLSELYAISNVPTVVWIDEDDHIVRPNGIAFGSDLFSDFTGVQSAPHKDAIRSWVNDGVVPVATEEARAAVHDLSEDEVLARLHFRIGADAYNQGNETMARAHLEKASELAPYDFTVRRAAMPLLGQDPFGQDFLNLYEEWSARGMPYHGLLASAQPGDASD
jgi:peroxiredoxin